MSMEQYPVSDLEQNSGYSAARSGGVNASIAPQSAPAPYRERPEPQSRTVPQRAQSRQFAFDGGAATYFGTALLGVIVTVLTLGLCYPFALVLKERWRAQHSFIEGRQLAFIGSGWGLFGLWWKWLLLMIVTLGVYGFWVGPRIARWKWEHTSWAQQIPSSYR